jgi:hypothetical protein
MNTNQVLNELLYIVRNAKVKLTLLKSVFVDFQGSNLRFQSIPRFIPIRMSGRRDNSPAARLQTPIHARFALHQAEVDHASAQAGRIRVAALQ